MFSSHHVDFCGKTAISINVQCRKLFSLCSSQPGVLKYGYCISDSGVCYPTKFAQCSNSSCSDIENGKSNKDYTVCVASFNTGNYLGVPKCQILNNGKSCIECMRDNQ